MKALFGTIAVLALLGDLIREGFRRGTGIGVVALGGAVGILWLGLITISVILGIEPSGPVLIGAATAGAALSYGLSVWSEGQEPQQQARRQPDPGQPRESTESNRAAPDHPDVSNNELNTDAIDPEDAKGKEMEGKYITAPPEMNFSNVAGMEELKGELAERIIEPLRNPEQYEQYGLSVDNGFLLYGPPGTGKTYISKALAGELGINYMEIKGTDVISKFVGEGSERVAEIFEEARANQPVMLFIDEIDALTPSRGGSNQHQDQTQVVNTFLEEISEINEKDQEIVLIGATNRIDEIDDAMLRSGRLGNQIEVPPPGPEARVKIFDAHLDAPRHDLDPQKIADRSEGLTAADMERVAKESARQAMQKQGAVGHKEVSKAIENVR
jgi:SpoVK/Ycf46/Vps4 family AAA+-type ATPase